MGVGGFPTPTRLWLWDALRWGLGWLEGCSRAVLGSPSPPQAPLPAQLTAHQRLVDLAYSKGLIVYSRRTRDGIEGDHILVCPPLIVTQDHIYEIIEGLDASLVQFSQDIHSELKAG